MHSGGLFLSPSILPSPPSQGSQWCFNALSRQLQVPFYFSQLVVSQNSFLVQNTYLSLYTYIYTCVLCRYSPLPRQDKD